MRRIKLPYNDYTAYGSLLFFGLPFVIALYHYLTITPTVFTLKELLQAKNSLRWYALPFVIVLCQFLPWFQFTPIKKVAKDKALFLLPYKSYIHLILTLISVFIAFASAIIFAKSNGQEGYWSLPLGIGGTVVCLWCMNHNRVLFSDDYFSKKEIAHQAYLKSTNGFFNYHKTGFHYKNKKTVFETQWEAITSILCYKKPNLYYDTLYLIIHTKNGEMLSINEDTEGWFVFVKTMEKIFPSIDYKWKLEMMLPVLEETSLEIYNKDVLTTNETTN